MDEQNRIEQLEQRIVALERLVKSLQESATGSLPSEKMKLKELEVETIKVVEDDGKVRLLIHNKERMPDPNRVGGSFAGMLFFAEDGVEIGGLIVDNTVSLKFDQHHSSDVVGLINWEINENESIRGLHVWDRPAGPRKEFMARFEQEHGRKPTVQEFEFSRVFTGRWITGEAKVALSDSKGRERLRLVVDTDDMPHIEFLDENGAIIHTLASDNFVPLILPPTDSLPKDLAERTPAHLLGIFGYDFDKSLKHLDQVRERLGEDIYVNWHAWLQKAKAMNSNEKTE